MRYIIVIAIAFFSLKAKGQDFIYELTSPKDSIKNSGLKVYLEIDSVYTISDSTGVKFALEMINSGSKVLRLTNPIYDTELNINPSLWLLPSKKRVKLKEVSRWPNPRFAKDFKPYRLENVLISGKEVPKQEYDTYWEMDTLSIKPGQHIRYELNLFEQLLVDENNKPHFEPLFVGEYYVIFDISLDLGNNFIRTRPLRFKMKLK